MDKAALRADIRKKRKQLTQQQQGHAAQQVVAQIQQQAWFIEASRVACYLSFDGELNTHPLITACWASGKEVYLPVIHPFSPHHLVFIQHLKTQPLTHNKFGILEPILDVQRLSPIQQLDIIFTPLVAFDKQLNRLGMGGGFYDRSLQCLRSSPSVTIVGLAHQCQQVESLHTESWDIPLNLIATPQKIYQ